MPIRLLTSGGGTTTIQPTTSASSVTLTVPSVNANVVTTGDTASVTQAMLGSGLAGTGPAFHVYLSTNQNVTGSTRTKVQLNTKLFDTANCFDNTTNYRFTPNVAGYYQINGSIYHNYTGSAGVRVETYIHKNGGFYSAYQLTVPSTVIYGGAPISTLVYLNGSTDYVELFGLNTSTTPQFYGDSTFTYMSGFLARAA